MACIKCVLACAACGALSSCSNGICGQKPKKGLNDQLREFGSLLGPSCDWDVFKQETLPKIYKRFPTPADYDHLCQQVELQRLAADDRLQIQRDRLNDWRSVEFGNSVGRSRIGRADRGDRPQSCWIGCCIG